MLDGIEPGWRLFREHRAEQEAQRVDFDGGPRGTLEPPPPASHDEWLLDLFRGTRTGDGTGWDTGGRG